MKTNTLRNKKLYLSSASALFLLCACVNGEKKSNQGAQGSLNYLYQDVPPETYGGAWKRVWNLIGPYSVDAPVDVMLNREADNWTEVARTNREGIFVQSDTTKETKYRFDGHLESEWMPTLSDTIIKTLTPENHFSGRRCVVPGNTTLVITNKKLIFRCYETIIEGKIIAYPGNTYNGRGAGSVDIAGEIITVKGSIHLVGEKGTGGSNGRDGRSGSRHNEYGGRNCGNGSNGGLGGNGGAILLKARQKINIADEATQLSVAGGPGGGGGRRGMAPGNCHDGAAGPKGSDGSTQVISLERPL